MSYVTCIAVRTSQQNRCASKIGFLTLQNRFHPILLQNRSLVQKRKWPICKQKRSKSPFACNFTVCMQIDWLIPILHANRLILHAIEVIIPILHANHFAFRCCMQMDFILHANEFEPGKSPKFLGQIQAISPHSGQFACAIATSSISAVFGAGPFHAIIDRTLPASSPLLSFCLCHPDPYCRSCCMHAKRTK